LTHRLDKNDHARALPLAQDAPHNLTLTAVGEGSSPGTIWVDDPQHPRAALFATPEGEFLIGRCGDDVRRAFADFITDELLPGGDNEGWWLCWLHYWPDDWRPVLQTMLTGHHWLDVYQHYYSFRGPPTEPSGDPPPGYRLQRVDAELLGKAEGRNVGRIKRYAKSNFGSVPAFLERGFGVCLMHGPDAVSWCMSDCVSGHRCEIGIHTDPHYRRRGMASLTVAATVEFCLSNGLTDIGWHCWSTNTASASTAERAGFERILDHHALQIWLRPADSLLVRANLALLDGRYAEAAELYERAFALDAADTKAASRLLSSPDGRQVYHYNAACAAALAGGKPAAAKHLAEALDRTSIRQAGY